MGAKSETPKNTSPPRAPTSEYVRSNSACVKFQQFIIHWSWRAHTREITGQGHLNFGECGWQRACARMAFRMSTLATIAFQSRLGLYLSEVAVICKQARRTAVQIDAYVEQADSIENTALLASIIGLCEQGRGHSCQGEHQVQRLRPTICYRGACMSRQTLTTKSAVATVLPISSARCSYVCAAVSRSTDLSTGIVVETACRSGVEIASVSAAACSRTGGEEGCSRTGGEKGRGTGVPSSGFIFY